MNVKKLIEVLKEEEGILQSLTNTASEKQLALIANNREKLDSCIKLEEKILPKLHEAEKQRLSVIGSYYLESGKTTGNYKLNILLDTFPELFSSGEQKHINQLQDRMKKLIEDLSKLNQQNIYLINHSRQFINETINCIINMTNRSILDKKV